MDIILADDFCYRERFDCIIPISVYVPSDGNEPSIAVYPDFLTIAQEFSRKFPDNILCNEALQWLNDQISAIIDEDYMRTEENITEIFLNFVAEFQSDIREESILPSSNMHIDDEEWDGQPCCTTNIGGNILSVAGVNDTMDEDEEGEISICVETEEEFRGKGFAASNVAALNRWLLGEGNFKKVKYECSCRNIPSVRTAEKAGMRLAGRTYYYVAYLRDGDLEE